MPKVRHLTIEYRWAENQLDRLPALAADLVQKKVAVILATGGTAPTIAAKAMTTTIPIVFLIPEDPVRSLDLPPASRGQEAISRASISWSAKLVAKRLELLHELVPAMTPCRRLVKPRQS